MSYYVDFEQFFRRFPFVVKCFYAIQTNSNDLSGGGKHNVTSMVYTSK